MMTALAAIPEVVQRIAEAKTPQQIGDLHREFAAAAKLLHGNYEQAFKAAAGWLMSGVRVGQVWEAGKRPEGRPKKTSQALASLRPEDFGLSRQTCDIWADCAELDAEDLRTYIEDRYECRENLSRSGLLHVHIVVDRGGSLMSSASPDWNTPPEILERVGKVLGEIDLDPCSNDGAPNVPATRHFKKKHDGLAQDWTGRVYMNPPYGRAIGEWVDKLLSEHGAGDVTEAIALVPARTDTDWFRKFRDFPVCFVDGRLRFSGKDPAPFPSAVVYLGKNIRKFARHFADTGDVWVRWREDEAA